jgi:uncharacterized membrane protein YedE/YeeE
MRSRLAGLGVGIVFGIVLSWSGMTSPVVIRQALLFEHAYLFEFFASAVITATAGVMLLRRLGVAALITGERIGWSTEPLQRRHITGSVLFGIGWGVADACPGPIATQVGQGIGWGAITCVGVIIGVALYQRRHLPETEPSREGPPAAAGRRAGASVAG